MHLGRTCPQVTMKESEQKPGTTFTQPEACVIYVTWNRWNLNIITYNMIYHHHHHHHHQQN